MIKKMSNAEWARQIIKLSKVDASPRGHNDHICNSSDGKIAGEREEVI